jgi:hypothetical protein
MNLAAFFVILTIILSLIVWKRTSEEVFDAEKIPNLIMVERANQSLDLSDESISQWRQEYSHPLLLTSIAHPHNHAYQVEVLQDKQMRKLSRLTFYGNNPESSEDYKRNSIDLQDSFKRSSELKNNNHV